MPLSTNMPADFVSHIHQALKACTIPPPRRSLPRCGWRSPALTGRTLHVPDDGQPNFAGRPDALRQTHPEAAKFVAAALSTRRNGARDRLP
jgi:hypothetical protein